MENKKPKHFLVFKIIGFFGIGLAIAGFILTFTGFGNFENNNFMIGGFMATFGLFIGIVCLMFGFRPEITKMSTKSAKYIQEANKENLTDIANISADIYDEAIAHTAKAIKKGVEEEKIYCKHCGAKIDADSKFCNKCGKEQ